MDSSARSAKTWGREIWEEKGKLHSPAQVVFGSGFSESQVNAQTARLMAFIESAFLNSQAAGARILDVGVGPLARFSIEFAKRGFRVTGLDVAESSLASARSVSRDQGVSVEFVNQDILELDRRGEFDGLFCVETFFHLPAHLTLEAFRVFNRSVRNGGKVLVQFAMEDRQSPLFHLREFLYFSAFRVLRPVLEKMGRKSFYVTVTRVTQAEVEDLAERSGFSIVRKEGTFFLFEKIRDL